MPILGTCGKLPILASFRSSLSALCHFLRPICFANQIHPLFVRNIPPPKLIAAHPNDSRPTQKDRPGRTAFLICNLVLCSIYSHSNVNLFTPRHTFAGCLQSGNGQVKQLGLYGQTPGVASWAGVTVLRPARGVLCGLWRVLAVALLGDMSGYPRFSSMLTFPFSSIVSVMCLMCFS